MGAVVSWLRCSQGAIQILDVRGMFYLHLQFSWIRNSSFELGVGLVGLGFRVEGFGLGSGVQETREVQVLYALLSAG